MHIILMRVVSIEVPVREPYCNVKVQWKRGDLKLETTNRIVIDPEVPVTVIDHTFKKYSAFYRNSKTGKYRTKLAQISIKGQANGESAINQPGAIKPKLLGELELDLASFVSAGDTAAATQEQTYVMQKSLPNTQIVL
jgi:hypothetical protein